MSFEIYGQYLKIGVWDVLDILIVAYFLYRLYIMLENTRAATLVKGLVVLFMFYKGSQLFDMSLIGWILDKGTTTILVALPVIFQPELRRALEQLGRGRLFRKRSELTEKDLDEMLDDITSACKVMSENKVGALIVFEGYSGLEERIDTGVPMDSLISDALVQQIFIKDTPLHDGAVIIRGNRIIAASCMLILTENRNLSQELGTRHRAALGVSEQSDCVAVVVSEETGTISVAKNGKLMRYLTPKDMRRILEKHVKEPITKHDNMLLRINDKLVKMWERNKNA